MTKPGMSVKRNKLPAQPSDTEPGGATLEQRRHRRQMRGLRQSTLPGGVAGVKPSPAEAIEREGESIPGREATNQESITTPVGVGAGFRAFTNGRAGAVPVVVLPGVREHMEEHHRRRQPRGPGGRA